MSGKLNDGFDEVADAVINNIIKPSADADTESISNIDSTPSTDNTCGNCHASIRADDNFCSSCGHPLNEMAQTALLTAIKEHRKGKTKLPITKIEPVNKVDVSDPTSMNGLIGQVLESIDADNYSEDSEVSEVIENVFSDSKTMNDIMGSLLR